jgi:predicted ATPase
VDSVREQAEALGSLATEHGFPYWGAIATIFEGWALAQVGDPKRAAAQIREGLAAFRETAAQVWLPYFLAILSEADELVGDMPKACQLLDEALDRVERTRERWYEAELHRRKGEAFLITSTSPVEAEACLARALAVAREQGARMWELRAATALARLWRERGKLSEARDLLASVYDWFTEGFDAPDLREARTLLQELASPRPAVGPS